MRKLTVLLLSGALLAITGGASVAGDKDVAILECILMGGPGVFVVAGFSHSFDEPPLECAQGDPCAPCAAETIGRGLILVKEHQSKFGDFRMIFTKKKAVLKR